MEMVEWNVKRWKSLLNSGTNSQMIDFCSKNVPNVLKMNNPYHELQHASISTTDLGPHAFISKMHLIDHREKCINIKHFIWVCDANHRLDRNYFFTNASKLTSSTRCPMLELPGTSLPPREQWLGKLALFVFLHYIQGKMEITRLVSICPIPPYPHASMRSPCFLSETARNNSGLDWYCTRTRSETY